MNTTRILSGAVVSGLLATLAPGAAWSAAGDECVKILGYEWSGEKQSMDPADMHSGDDAYHTFAVYNRLVDVDDNFNVIPELATEWAVSDDGLTWTFTLRDGVTFHSGKAFSSADVVYTFKRLLDEATGSGAAAVLEFLDPDGITAPDPHTVKFTTKTPVVELPVLISNKFTNIVPDGATSEELRLHGDGTGPFMQEQFEPNAPVRILRKNPNYWAEGLPKADCLRITVAQEAVAAVAAIKSGQVDLMLNVDPSVIPTLQGDSSVELLETGASNSMTVSMWVDTPPFDNAKVREAMKLVVDRQAMIDTVLLGFGEPGADNPVPLGSPASFTTEAPAQDIERAKALLAEAGHPDGLKFDLYTAEGVPGMVRMAQVYAEMARPAGIDVNVVVTPAESFWDDVWLKKPIVTSAWSMRPPGQGLAVAYVQSAKWKETHWERPDYDALLQAANTTVDRDERMRTYQKAGEMLAAEGGLILPMFVHQVLALRTGCSGYVPLAQNFNLNFETLACE
ncbi:ABC transporter substrate-binding protein [Pikeienuella piscinae]|uniref:ABC transporter substrate-binding protein n=1 Tax=Pikeienuella piscinae TaxID=2748098 RepID=A0A7L5BV15_9RHOB|nr:ABC transporter substrate-binding protein [Pikeienuella piscinae]QIE54618.1 ABC transporter substrate-binding protein [Pikeienuella piscinae]